MTPAGEIYLPKDDYLKTPDYSKATGENRHWFIHEMVSISSIKIDNIYKFKKMDK